MEFKGTKGKWKVLHMDDVFIENENGKSILRINSNGIYDYNERPYNALLISKAPEMLEMLKELLASEHIKGTVLESKVKQLIKEATTI